MAYPSALASEINWKLSPFSQASLGISVLFPSSQQSKLEQVPVPPKMVNDCSTTAPAGKLNGLASNVKSKLAALPSTSPATTKASPPAVVKFTSSEPAPEIPSPKLSNTVTVYEPAGRQIVSVLVLEGKSGAPLATTEPPALVISQLVSAGYKSVLMLRSKQTCGSVVQPPLQSKS